VTIKDATNKRDSVHLPKARPTRLLGKTVWNLALYALQRLAFGLVVLLAIVLLTYLGLDMAGGTSLGEAIPDAVSRTVRYVARLASGDLGLTVAGSDTALPRPVSVVLLERLPRSLVLLGVSLTLAALLGTTLGIIAARSGSRGSLLILLVTIVGVSVPSFFAAFLLQWAVISSTRALGHPLLPVGGFGWDKHLVLPAIVLAARPLAQTTRIAFISVQQTLTEDYVRTARSKGLGRIRVMATHVLRNAAIPILTTIGVSLRYSLSSLPVVELYFGWTGVGLTLLRGISQRDDDLTVALVLCLGTLFILVNLVLEVSYRIIDPRLRQRPAHTAQNNRLGILPALWSAVKNLSTLLKRKQPQKQSPGATVSPQPEKSAPPDTAHTKDDTEPDQHRDQRRRWRITLGNVPLIVGGLLVCILVIAVFFGPQLAPNNPSRTQGLIKIDGEFVSPPFAPNDTYPWGTDALGRGLLSMILAGARQTLLLAVLAVAARTAIGVVLGTVAGWMHDTWLDRAVLSCAEIIAAFPTLLLAMMLILALGIRKGMPPFILSLCFVGWGEITQFVRSQVIAIRPRPYIESAVAVGARTPRILGRHILPHLFSSLISIVALEMGAVLMILGELGFVSILIGGGTVIAQTNGQLILHSDVPEWGAMLSNLRHMARSYPWTALYPMLAFFLSILSFNLFSEGIRRLIDQGGLIINRLFNRYTITLAIVSALGLYWLNANTGAIPFYRQRAQTFDGERAMQHVQALTDPQMQGRALGTDGLDRAAGYISEQFEALGLQAAGAEGTFFQEQSRAFQRFDAIPQFDIRDGGPALLYGQDYALFPSHYTTRGIGQGPVSLLCVGGLLNVQTSTWRPTYVELDRLDLSDQILLVPSEAEAELLSWRAQQGLLVIASDPASLERRATIGGRPHRTDHPRLWVSVPVAERLLGDSEYELPELQERCATLPAESVLHLSLPTQANLQVTSTVEEHWPVVNVMGYIPGTHSYDYCYDCLGKQLILVMVQYDSPALGPDGAILAAANDNASGVAVMLEAIRVIQETDYEPYKSMFFVAYSGEGLEGGEIISSPDVKRFLHARPGMPQFELEAIVQLRGVGTASGRKLEISASGSLRLAEMFERVARQTGVKTTRAEEGIDISVVYDERSANSGNVQEAPTVRLAWQDWQDYAETPSDTIENVSEDHLEQAGRALAMGLMILGRERDY